MKTARHAWNGSITCSPSSPPLATLRVWATAWTLLVGTAAGLASDALENGFRHPPASARPWVYWFPLDGNISSNGITLDLEAMARVGIGGVLYMETDQGAPRGPAAFGSPLWRDLFKHICSEANRLGIQVNMNNDAGWCGSGGPWVPPELSMQRVVWTETAVTGPKAFDAILPQPKAVKDFYRDIAVFAFPTPSSNYAIAHLSGKSAETREEIPLQADFAKLPGNAVVTREQIVDLTAKCDGKGRLLWEVPAGQWTLLRLGHTTTGKDNHPAPLAGRGLECDKLSQEAADVMFAGLMKKLMDDSKPLVGEKKTLVSTHIDSWEVGSQNWTPKFRAEFRRLRGYDPLPLLPVMAGRVIDSLEVSERFLWDVRATVNDLLLANYAAHFSELARRHGIRLSIEAYDGAPADDLAYGGRADEPMAEFWSWAKFSAAYSCTEMASAAHIYGRPILGAEAFTATDAEKWQGHPALIKDLGDWAFCEGINRFVFHRYALQPWTDARPGMSMGPWGLHYERTQTWWEQSKAWHEYLARCQFLLQQGKFVADLCILEPEMSIQRFKSPVKSGYDRPPYNFDGCPPDALLTRMKVKDGRLVLPDGMSYRWLVLPKTEAMTPALLRKIKDLVAAGATVVGAPPRKSPSLSGYPQCDAEVTALAGELWGTGQPPKDLTARPFGKGRIFWGGEFSPSVPTAESAGSSLASAKWIWYKEGSPARLAPPGKRYFRRLFNLDAGSHLASARLEMTADNEFHCWVNGRSAGSGTAWERVYSREVTALLKPGENLICVEAVNTTDQPSPAGLIGALKLDYGAGHVVILTTDGQWQSSITTPAQWTADPALTGAWAPSLELGPFGMRPWGNIQSTLPATDPTPDANLLCALLKREGVPPDFEAETRPSPQSLRYIHKTIGDLELYFVANKNPQLEAATCSFRVSGRRPELWWPDSGRVEHPAIYDEAGGMTHLPIHFDPSGSVFVLFRKGPRPEPDRILSVSRDGVPLVAAAELKASPPFSTPSLTRDATGGVTLLTATPGDYTLKTAAGQTSTVPVPAFPSSMELSGSWSVRFPPNWGAPEGVTFDHLISWSEHSDPGVQHFSGTATYAKTFDLAPDFAAKDRRLYLDLGRVAVMAEVKLNGQTLGILWKPPFRIDITDSAKPGQNTLEIRVVNLWINRQIGDEQLPEDSERNPNGTLKAWPQWVEQGKPSPTGRFTFTSWRLWKKNDPLVESGLIGPVTVQAEYAAKIR